MKSKPETKKELRKCENCGQIMEKKPWLSWPKYNKKKYCSTRCSYDFQKKNKQGWWKHRD